MWWQFIALIHFPYMKHLWEKPTFSQNMNFTKTQIAVEQVGNPIVSIKLKFRDRCNTSYANNYKLIRQSNTYKTCFLSQRSPPFFSHVVHIWKMGHGGKILTNFGTNSILYMFFSDASLKSCEHLKCKSSFFWKGLVYAKFEPSFLYVSRFLR